MSTAHKATMAAGKETMGNLPLSAADLATTAYEQALASATQELQDAIAEVMAAVTGTENQPPPGGFLAAIIDKTNNALSEFGFVGEQDDSTLAEECMNGTQQIQDTAETAAETVQSATEAFEEACAPLGSVALTLLNLRGQLTQVRIGEGVSRISGEVQVIAQQYVDLTV